MACACKVTKYVNRIDKRYGQKTWQNKKSNISGMIKNWFYNALIAIISLPFLPIITLYLIVRKCFSKKPILLDKIFKLK